MQRPTKFEHNRWLGDRRNQVVYDLDELEDSSIIDELMQADKVEGLSGPAYTCFGPDTLVEARNRGYRPYRGESKSDSDQS